MKAATPAGRRRGGRGEARAQAQTARPLLKLTVVGYYLSRAIPAGELTESLEKETGCGRLAAGS